MKSLLNVQVLDLAVDGATTDAQQSGGFGLIPARLFEGLANDFGFVLLGAQLTGSGTGNSRQHVRRQMLGKNHGVEAENKGVFRNNFV